MSVGKWVLLFLITAPLAAAQSGSSVISGIVRDVTDAPIPGADVKLLNLETGVQLETATNASGVYRIGALVPGSYRLEVAAPGFDTARREPLELEVNQTLAIDFALQVGQQNETITVTESAPLVESQSSDIGQRVSRQMLVGLPLPNRAASSLVALAPGVVMIDTGTGTAENYPVFSVTGGRTRNQHFLLDGGNASNAVALYSTGLFGH